MITFELSAQSQVPGFYWLVIRVGDRAVGYIAKNVSLDKFYLLHVYDSFGNTAFAKDCRTVESAKAAFLKLPISILPVGGTVNASGAPIDSE